jgi:hypothetical protein
MTGKPSVVKTVPMDHIWLSAEAARGSISDDIVLVMPISKDRTRQSPQIFKTKQKYYILVSLFFSLLCKTCPQNVYVL